MTNSEPEVDELVRKGAEKFKKLGATVEEISIPLHALGIAIWTPIAVEGATMQMMHGNGFGFNWKGLYLTSLMDHHANWRGRADELSESLKVTILAGNTSCENIRVDITRNAKISAVSFEPPTIPR